MPARPVSALTSSVGWSGVGLMLQLVVGRDQPEGLAARRAELLLVDLSEQVALVEFQRPARCRGRLPPSVHLQQLDANPATGRRKPVDEPHQAAPGAFEATKPGVVQDGIELRGDQGVDGRDIPVERGANDV